MNGSMKQRIIIYSGFDKIDFHDIRVRLCYASNMHPGTYANRQPHRHRTGSHAGPRPDDASTVSPSQTTSRTSTKQVRLQSIKEDSTGGVGHILARSGPGNTDNATPFFSSPTPIEEPLSAMPTRAASETSTTEAPDSSMTPDDSRGGWRFLLDQSQTHDKELLEKWTKEIDNLLIFAALFSAIVTAFVIQSYPSLQQDPADATTILLAQISSQLLSFTVSSGFINSTTPSPMILASASPGSRDFLVNGLWFLSLTLSILTAFFGILVQQWLRSLSLPGHLSIWSTIRLRRRRHSSMIYFQIPNIIALLPTLLQFAVILFLFGLFLLLQGLNTTIAAIYAALTGFAMILYAASLLAALNWPETPFKSPLIPSIIFIASWCMVFFWLIVLWSFTAASAVVLAGIRAGTGFQSTGRPPPASAGAQRLTARVRYTLEGLRLRVATLRAPLVARTRDFWAEREIRRLHAGAQMSEYGDALAQAPQLMHRDLLATVRPCLASLPVRDRARCVLAWVYLYLGEHGDLGFVGTAGDRAWAPVRPDVLEKVIDSFPSQFEGDLLDAVPRNLTSRTSKNWIREVKDLSSVFMILVRLVTIKHQGNGSNHEFFLKVVNILCRVCVAQLRTHSIEVPEDVIEYSHLRYPVVCLFGCLNDTLGHWKVENPRVRDWLRMAADHIELVSKNALSMNNDNKVEIVFCSVALSLLAVWSSSITITLNPEEVGELNRILKIFDEFVLDESKAVRAVCGSSSPFKYSRALDAIKSIANSMVQLSGRGLVDATCSRLIAHQFFDLRDYVRNLDQAIPQSSVFWTLGNPYPNGVIVNIDAFQSEESGPTYARTIRTDAVPISLPFNRH